MGFLDKARDALNVDNDALADHRRVIGRNVGGMSAALILPFAVLHLLGGRWPMLLVNVVLLAVLVANTRALHRERAAPIPFWLLCVLMLVGVCISVLQQGVQGALWSFPALFMFFFLLPRRVAMALGLALLVGVTASSVVALGVPLAARVFGSMLLTLAMINVVLNVVGNLQKSLVAQAITDPLTGAFNRRHLKVHLDRMVVSAESPPPQESLLIFDVDHFKLINDRCGHDAGDEVLRRLAATVVARKRRDDLLFRIGGEEFLLLLPGASIDDAQRVADELLLRLGQAELLPDARVTVSIGVSTLEAGQSAEIWVKRADLALYEAKRGGRDRVVVAAATPLPASVDLVAG